MFLGLFDPPFYELGNFVKILDPPPVLKKFPSETWELCEIFLTPLPLLPSSVPVGKFNLNLD